MKRLALALLASLSLACPPGPGATGAGPPSSTTEPEASSSSTEPEPTVGEPTSSPASTGPVPLTVAESTGGDEPTCDGPQALRPVPWAATGVERVLPAGGDWEALWAAEIPFCGLVGSALVLDVVAELGAMEAGGARLDLRVKVDGAVAASREGLGPSPTSGFVIGTALDYSRSLAWSVAHFPPEAGSLVVELQGRSSANLRLRDLRVVALVP